MTDTNITIEDDEWTTVDDESAGVAFEHENDLRIDVEQYGDRYRVTLNRWVESDGYGAYIQTHEAGARTIDEATDVVLDIVEEVDVTNGVTAIMTDSDSEGDETYYYFYCVFEGLLPDGLDANDITVGGNGIEPATSAEIEEDIDLDNAIQFSIDVYPVPGYYVEEVDSDD